MALTARVSVVTKFNSKIFLGLIVAGSAMVSSSGFVSAAPDFPWSCRDADAVLAAARQYSFNNSPVTTWDTRKILQADKEYAQCFKEAADAEDRLKAVRGTTSVWHTLASRDYTYAMNANLLSTNEVSRQRFFRKAKSDALEEYRIAQKFGRLAIDIANDNGIAIDAFERWVQHSISDPMAELSATEFKNLKSRSVLLGKTRSSQPVASKPPVRSSTVRSAVSHAPARVQTCERPNAPATTLRAVEPDMPAEAQEQGIQGTVQVIVSLDATSNITSTRIQSSPSRVLNEPALSAARHSSFQTEIRDCKPIAADYIFGVDFQSQ